MLYAVVDSRWPQKPGLCIDAAGAVGRPDGMVATVATVAVADVPCDGVTDRHGTSGRWHKQQCEQNL